MFAGLIVFNFFAECTAASPGLITGNKTMQQRLFSLEILSVTAYLLRQRIHQFFCTNSSTISHRTIEMDNDTDTYRMDPNIICMLRLLMAAIGNWDLPKRRRAAYTSISKYNDVS